MNKIEFAIKTPSTEWMVCQGKTFGVQVKAWHSSMGWNWNVYALIFDGHPMNGDVEAAMSLPLHWGATYDKRILTTPAQGIRYDWEKSSNCLKVGSDYGHCDDSFEHCDPKDGIPALIRFDAEELANALIAAQDATITIATGSDK